MAEQLTFELAGTPPPRFDNFVAGPNVEAVQTLQRIVLNEMRETGLVLWGAGGAGKTHLLHAAAAHARAHGRSVVFIDDVNAPGDVVVDGNTLVAVDDIDAADASAQARMFTLYNLLAAHEGQLIAAAASPPALMTLRDDLRTRLGWGLVYEVLPLSDADKPSALSAFAHARGFHLSDEVIGWLLAHGRRDMASLVQTLIALDRHSLALQRPITVPLLREWLQQRMFAADRDR